MNSDSTKRTVIIAAVDRTSASDHVVDTTTSLARAMPGAEVHVAYVVEPVVDPAGILAPTMMGSLSDGRVFIDGVRSSLSERIAAPVAAHLGLGDPAGHVLQLASDLAADLIVVGSHGKKAFARLVMGSVSKTIVQKAQCPVLVARAKAYSASEAPEIEPPCPKCLEVQQATKGDSLWCEAHSSRHAHGRLHYEVPASFAVGSMLLRPGS